MTNSSRTPPPGYTTVTPWIISPDTAALLRFMTRAFGAKELARVMNADGSIGHAEVRIGDAVVMAFDAKPGWKRTPAFLRLYVPDAHAAYRQALDVGATPVTEVTDLFFGERVGRVRDPQGNIWWLQTRVEEIGPEEMQKRAGEKKYLDAMAYVQSSLDEALSKP